MRCIRSTTANLPFLSRPAIYRNKIDFSRIAGISLSASLPLGAAAWIFKSINHSLAPSWSSKEILYLTVFSSFALFSFAEALRAYGMLYCGKKRTR